MLAGRLHSTVDGQQRVLETGEEFVVPVNAAHTWGNPTDEPAVVRVRLTPSKLAEEFFAAFCRVATDGGANRAGLPKNPLQFAVLADAHRDEFAFASPFAELAARRCCGCWRSSGGRPASDPTAPGSAEPAVAHPGAHPGSWCSSGPPGDRDGMALAFRCSARPAPGWPRT